MHIFDAAQPTPKPVASQRGVPQFQWKSEVRFPLELRWNGVVGRLAVRNESGEGS